ncbi:uncharacterized protein BX664DRAFT_273917 [Halteromyces radiatus]|uniref:uncharacterized protein n=1 Tax=Halteromyces radiatus TaxID=101107 RepID=UPI002220405D|nr:uncharacterized protein BX664DRAFT_273917 [Halteromyces radiatus]KAI8100173.1 hypothetical protein BX664DRAFT_273917 [Halteromyces radiatus]
MSNPDNKIVLSNGFMTEYDLSYATAKVELNDSSIYHHQQDPSSFGYIPTSHSLIQDMETMMYSQNTTSTTNLIPPVTHQQEQHHSIYNTTNPNIIASCISSAQQTRPMMTDTENPITMETDTTMMMTTSISASTTTTSASPTFSHSASPTSSTSVPLSTSMGSHSSLSNTMRPPFLSPVSPSISSGTALHRHLANTNQSDILTYSSSPFQQLSTSSSPTFINPSQRHDSTIRSTINLPVMTTSASAPTTMTSSSINNNSHASSPLLQHSLQYQSSPLPTHDDTKDCDHLNMDHSQNQSNTSVTSNSELRRQIHIQSEQKRRAQIKDGFEDLRNELPSCLNKKMSKVALLHRTVQHIQHLKNTQITILGELERLMTENEHLRKFQESVLQK